MQMIYFFPHTMHASMKRIDEIRTSSLSPLSKKELHILKSIEIAHPEIRHIYLPSHVAYKKQNNPEHGLKSHIHYEPLLFSLDIPCSREEYSAEIVDSVQSKFHFAIKNIFCKNDTSSLIIVGQTEALALYTYKIEQIHPLPQWEEYTRRIHQIRSQLFLTTERSVICSDTELSHFPFYRERFHRSKETY
jgi:hypothetical protein